MKTRTTRVTLTKNSISDSDCFDIEIADENGEYVAVSCGINGNSISINPDEWPFLRDAIDRMFVEIAEHESEGKLKKLLETPAPWDTSGASGEEQALPASDDDGWIPWNGGKCPVDPDCNVLVRLRSEAGPDPAVDPLLKAGDWYWEWDGVYPEGDIIAYKVVD